MMKKLSSDYFKSYEGFVREIPPEYEDEVKSQYARESFQRLRIASILFLGIVCISVLRDLYTGFYHRPQEPYNFLHLISFAFMFLSAFAVVGASLLDKRVPLAPRVLVKLHIMFYININLALALLMFNEFYRGYYTTYEQFYWLFFAFVPLMHLRSNCINICASFVIYLSDYILVMILHDITFLNLLYIVPIFLTMECFGLYLRKYYLKNIIYDIQNRLLQEKLKNRSMIDPLTGCYNRYAMQEQFERLCAEEKRLSLFMFDIDKFKLYNDTFSHIEGDRCLNQISTAVTALCHASGMELFRYGGEEFIVLSKAMSEAEQREAAAKLLGAVRALRMATPALDEFGNIVTISVGAATVDVGLSLKDSIRLADEQLYLAKKHGRNCAFYRNEKIQ